MVTSAMRFPLILTALACLFTSCQRPEKGVDAAQAQGGSTTQTESVISSRLPADGDLAGCEQSVHDWLNVRFQGRDAVFDRFVWSSTLTPHNSSQRSVDATYSFSDGNNPLGPMTHSYLCSVDNGTPQIETPDYALGY